MKKNTLIVLSLVLILLVALTGCSKPAVKADGEDAGSEPTGGTTWETKQSMEEKEVENSEDAAVQAYLDTFKNDPRIKKIVEQNNGDFSQAIVHTEDEETKIYGVTRDQVEDGQFYEVIDVQLDFPTPNGAMGIRAEYNKYRMSDNSDPIQIVDNTVVVGYLDKQGNVDGEKVPLQ